MRSLLAFASVAVASAAGPWWWSYPDSDIIPAAGSNIPVDVAHFSGQTLAQLEAHCLATPGCLAVNSDGYLKNCTPPNPLCQVVTGQPCTLAIANSTGPQPAPPVYNGPMLWPLPHSMTFGNGNLTVSPAVSFVAGTPSADLTAAFARFSAILFPHAVPSSAAATIAAMRAGGAQAQAQAPVGAVLSTINVNVANVNVPLQLDVDESYTLSIPADGSPAVITANTVYGAYQALQTLSQVVTWIPDTKTYQVSGAPVMITDAPSYAWRGILIDSDRHFLPVPTILRIVDSLTMAKMNILHWHIVDWQSWPMESAAYPNLWSAAWSFGERYTFEDVATVVEYARQRGVRVVAEFDTPGHAGSICTGYPQVCPSPTCTMPLNPASADTLPLVNAVLTELAALTPDNFFHLGGDEVDTSCWSSTPSIVAWMAAQNYTTDQTYEYFVTAVDAMAIKAGKIPVRWEEVWKHFRTALDPRTVIHVWLSTATMADVVNNGYRGIYSVDGQYYLDALDDTSAQFYNIDILAGITNVTARQYVLGGEVEMWGETADVSEVMSTIWPRAGAAAERWWNYPGTSTFDASGVAERYSWFRCQMMARGYESAPVNNAGARSAPPGPGSCITQ